jgi:Bacterial Ig domain
MSYSWQTQCKVVSPVQSYAAAADPTFFDWGYLQHNFSDSELHLGNTLGKAFGAISEDDQATPEVTLADYINQNGPPDTAPPSVAIISPKANGNVGLTLPLAVTVSATDNNAVQSVTVSLDVNGDGMLESKETVSAKLSGANIYKANFPALSGPPGARMILAAALDPSFNSGTAKITVNVQNPNPGSASVTVVNPAPGGGASNALTFTIN